MEGIAGTQIEAFRVSRGEFAQGCETTPISLDRDNAACPRCKQGPRQTTRAGPDLDDRGVIEPTRRARDPTRQVEIEQKILTEALIRGDRMSRDNLAQRRQQDRRGIGGRNPAGRVQPTAIRRAAMSAASRSAAIRLSARAMPRPAIAKAVP